MSVLTSAERVRALVVAHFLSTTELTADGLTDESNLAEDLGFDSLDKVEFIIALEDEFGIELTDDQSDAIQTVGDAIKAAVGTVAA